MKIPLPFLFGGVLAGAAILTAGDPLSSELLDPADKSAYHLFHPTPPAQRRELSPDRPDATESPVTVDAGVWVVESSFIDWRRDRGDESTSVMPTNLKVGLTHRTDLQFVFEPHLREDPALGAGAEGFGDVQLRLKHNLWGNEGGSSAFALFPFIKIPTGGEVSNGKVEGGLILPFGTQLTEGIGLGLMAEIDAVHDEGDDDHHAEFTHSAVLGFDLTERLGLFTEYIGVHGPGPYQAYLSAGLTLSFNEDLVLDCGAQAGINDVAEDLGLFTGFTRRF